MTDVTQATLLCNNLSSSVEPVRGHCPLPGSPLQSRAHLVCRTVPARSLEPRLAQRASHLVTARRF